jgi:hypothetical protein
MNNTFRQLLTFSTLATASLLLVQPQAQAITFSLDPSSNTAGGEFKYNLILDAGESITQGNGGAILADYLALTNFTGTTTASNPYTLNGSGATSANLSVNTNTSGATTLSNVVTVNATNFSVGTIDYDLSYNGGILNGTVTGPITSVPFEPSANLGIFTLLGFVGFNHFRKKLKAAK